jgi:2-iminobutanoate/2-iminopropanoate deaminase
MKPIHTDNAPAAVGPYSQAIATTVTGRPGEMVFCSGQIPLIPDGQPGEMPNDIEGQTTQVLENLTAVLVAAGCDRTRVVKTTIYVTDLAHFGTVNEVYGRYFPDCPPARATVQVAALPLGAQVEIDAIAIAY